MGRKPINPGSGAIEFALQYVDGLSEDLARPIIDKLVAGNLHDSDDKRIKKCDWCGYYFRDKTKPNTAKVCCRQCKYSKSNAAKAKKKADEALLNPTKKVNTYTYYADHLEYPYYANEKYMLSRAARHEVQMAPASLEVIHQLMSRNYKTKAKNTPTDGSDKFEVRGLRHGHSYEEVVISKLEPGYFEELYGERHLAMERWRAQQFKCSKKVHS
ncbi:hypothetical protein [Cytobacillus kochii]|uniref:hypothetical protein n=1 Tax=Cytobacillus kochii TaxID=859143 RepID=UPI00402A85E2